MAQTLDKISLTNLRGGVWMNSNKIKNKDFMFFNQTKNESDNYRPNEFYFRREKFLETMLISIEKLYMFL